MLHIGARQWVAQSKGKIEHRSWPLAERDNICTQQEYNEKLHDVRRQSFVMQKGKIKGTGVGIFRVRIPSDQKAVSISNPKTSKELSSGGVSEVEELICEDITGAWQIQLKTHL